ncbi:MAG: hypothetical protein QM781_18920 [Chitinophagaceae bacterium]
MAYNIRHIDNVSLTKEKKYFFDANLWLKILKPKVNPSSRDLKYLEFFEKFSTSQNKPKIVLPLTTLSEFINRYLRDVGHILFCKKTGVDPTKTHFKEIYRASEQYTTDYISLLEDIKSYQNLYELVDDGLGKDVRQKAILTSPPQHLDFNDNFCFQLAKVRGYVIVTDDKDFFVEDVEVLTYNQQLIDKAKSTVTPVANQ